jgi:GTP-binding protein
MLPAMSEIGTTALNLDPALVETGRLLFAREWDFAWASSKLAELPPMQGLEIAFAGRSNVGKSSLINALTGRNALARTSNTPGRTQQLNFFRALDLKAPSPLTIVDMPGYGYAAVGKEKVANWTQLIQDYLRGRANLARVYLLIDGRHGIKETDKPVLDQLDTTAVSYQVVLTKADAVGKAEQAQTLDRVKAAILKRPAAHPEVLFTSSDSGAGIVDLRTAIVTLLQERQAI